MPKVFFVLVLMFAAASFVYLWLNDFADETQPVIFPAIGAILLSGYLGYKAIWIDAPRPNTTTIVIALAENSQTRELSGLSGAIGLTGPQMLQETIWKIPRLHTEFSEDSSLARKVVEYAILHWLSLPQQSLGMYPKFEVSFFTDWGWVGGGVPSVQPHLHELEVGGHGWNNLLDQEPINLSMPARSDVQRLDPARLGFVLKTQHSHLTFEHLGGAKGNLMPPTPTEDLERFRRSTGLIDDKYCCLRGEAIQITSRTLPHKRHSRQAKIEAEWMSRILSSLENHFAWDRVRRVHVDGRF